MEIIVHRCRYNFWCCRRSFFGARLHSGRQTSRSSLSNCDNICFRSLTHLIEKKKRPTNTSDNRICDSFVRIFHEIIPLFCFHIYSWLQIIIIISGSSSGNQAAGRIGCCLCFIAGPRIREATPKSRHNAYAGPKNAKLEGQRKINNICCFIYFHILIWDDRQTSATTESTNSFPAAFC